MPQRRTIMPTLALVTAIVAGALLLFLPRPAPVGGGAPGDAAGLALADAWPSAKVITYPGRLDDGEQFSPLLHIDETTAVGTARTPDATAVRVMLRTAKGATEIRRLSKDLYPEFAGFTASGDFLVWAETTYPPGVEPQTHLWRLDLRGAGGPVLITADTGRAVFFQTQYDIVVADNAVHWVAAEFTNVTMTQVRTVPIGGGTVSVRRELGTYALSAWPWLVTPYGGRSDPARLVNLATGQKITVAHTPGELTRCSPTWCRVGIVGSKTLIRIDITRPDGTGRRRIAGGDASPILNDVALLDRFEILVADSAPGEANAGQRLDLYDIASDRTVRLGAGVVNALARGGMLWWATGPENAYTWQVLDLRRLTP